jgi:hypothetical protein
MLGYRNIAPLGLKYKIHADLQEFRFAAANSITKMLFCLSAPAGRHSCRNQLIVQKSPSGATLFLAHTNNGCGSGFV